MPHKCVLCGVWDDMIPKKFDDGALLKKITKENVFLWSFVFGYDIHVGDRVCRQHFDGKEEPIRGGGDLTPKFPSPNHIRGRHPKYGPQRPLLQLSERETQMQAQIEKLHTKIQGLNTQLSTRDAKIVKLRNLLYGRDVQRMMISKNRYNMYREHYLSTPSFPRAFNIMWFKEHPKSIRRLTSAPTWEELERVAHKLKPYYDQLFASTDREQNRDINPINAVALLFMKGRLDLPYSVCGDFFLVTPKWAQIIVTTLLKGFGIEFRAQIRLLSSEELRQHQVHRNIDDKDWKRRLGAVDKTYLYLQHSSAFDIQTDTFSGHHYTNEAQWLEFVAPDSLLMLLEGPYWVELDDYHFQAMIDPPPEGHGAGKWMEEMAKHISNPILEVDRGFRHAKEQVPPNIEIRQPAYLSGRDAFDASEAISSELSSSERAVVEQTNSRLNIQRIIRNNYPNKGIAHAELWMLFAGIIHNMWYLPFRRATPLTIEDINEEEQIAQVLSNL